MWQLELAQWILIAVLVFLNVGHIIAIRYLSETQVHQDIRIRELGRSLRTTIEVVLSLVDQSEHEDEEPPAEWRV